MERGVAEVKRVVDLKIYIVLFIKQVGMEIVYGYRVEWQGSHTWVTVYVGGFVEKTCYGLMKAKVEVTFFYLWISGIFCASACIIIMN